MAIPKSSLTHLLKTLVGRGYLEYDAVTKGYSLGPALIAIGQRGATARTMIEAAGSVLQDVSLAINETCALNVLKGDYSEVVAVASGTHRLQYSMRVGDRAPLYATSGGKALLANLPAEMREDYLSRLVFEPITPHTINNRPALEAELAEVVASGFAMVNEEFTLGITGMARAVLSSDGFPLAAINIAVPTTRYSDELKQRCRRTLAQAVTVLSERVNLPGQHAMSTS